MYYIFKSKLFRSNGNQMRPYQTACLISGYTLQYANITPSTIVSQQLQLMIHE